MRQKKCWFTISGILVALAIAVMLPATVAARSFKTIHKFGFGNDGALPYAGVISDAAGNLYGTTYQGGGATCSYGPHRCGTVYKLSHNSHGSWMESELHRFTGGSDGIAPLASLIVDGAGNLYGTTSEGGDTNCGSNGCGTVFKLALNSDGSWTESILYSFTGGEDGSAPYYGSLTFDGAGNLYGTTYGGGVQSRGTVFKLAANSDGSWTESLLYSFCDLTNCVDGGGPLAGVTFDATGNLYGTTEAGGDPNCGKEGAGCGAVFKLTPNLDGSWTESVLYSFTGGKDGQEPTAGLTFDGMGNLYGTTYFGGHNRGIVFKLTPNSDGTWTESVLHRFDFSSDGANPFGSLTSDAAGNLYGTTVHNGGVFRLAPRSGGRWAFSVIYGLGGPGGIQPYGSLVFDKAGKVYGTTFACAEKCRGSVFQVTP
jgi:uncharacterized repeat protein (TIGR03803 family)